MGVVGVTDFNRRDIDKPVKERTVNRLHDSHECRVTSTLAGELFFLRVGSLTWLPRYR